MNIDAILLRCAVFVLGRWALYELTGKCELPACFAPHHAKHTWVKHDHVVLSSSSPQRRGTDFDSAMTYAWAKFLELEKTIVEPFPVYIYEDGEVEKATKTSIRWPKIPNHSMLPQSIAAQIIFVLFLRVAGRTLPGLYTPGPEDGQTGILRREVLASRVTRSGRCLYDRPRRADRAKST